AGDTNNKSDIFVRDRLLGTTERVSVTSMGHGGDGSSNGPSISADGMRVAFQSAADDLVAGDTNGTLDVFVFDRSSGSMVRASVDDSGVESDGDCDYPTVAPDGSVVAFSSVASNLVSGDSNGASDCFFHHLDTGDTVRISVDSFGNQADEDSNLI